MADAAAPAPAPAPALGPAPGPARPAGPAGLLCAAVAARPGLAAGALVALAVALLFALVYYRGLGPLGPFAAPYAGDAGAGAPRKKGKPPRGADPDDETARLIASINDSG